MKYYSRSEKRMKTLVLNSYKISSDSLPEMHEISGKVGYFFMEDNRLGKMKIRSHISESGSSVIQKNVCISRVRKWGMRVFDPGDFISYRIFFKTAGGYYYVSVQMMKVRSGIMKSLDLLGPENFGNRLRADTAHLFQTLGIRRRIDLAPFR